MSSGKVYFWLKLDKDFFEDDTIEWIEEQENGKDYIIFYLKLCLKSLQDEGYLIRYVGEKLIPYDIKALAKLTNTSPDTVAVAMKIFIEIGLITRLDSGEIYLNQINEMMGSETDSAKRVRRHRAKEKMLQSNGEVLQSNSGVTKCNTEIEIEIDKEIDEDEELNKDNDINNPFKFYSKNIAPLVPAISDLIKGYQEELPDELIIKAFEISVANNVRNMRYAEKIINSWLDNNIKSIDEYEAHEASRQSKKSSTNEKKNNKPKPFDFSY